MPKTKTKTKTVKKVVVKEAVEEKVVLPPAPIGEGIDPLTAGIRYHSEENVVE